MAHFTLGPGQVARAVAHRTVEEVWYFLSGQGPDVAPAGRARRTPSRSRRACPLSIPLGTHFQLRNDADEPLAAVAVTMPPWPGDDEAYFVEGKWPANVGG